MKVGLIAPPWVSVPPQEYGGTELVVDVLARGLVAAGHDVELFASGDSTCPVPSRSLFATALGTSATSMEAEAGHVVEGYARLADCDVIHDHTFLGALYGRPSSGQPVVVTSHGPFRDELGQLYDAISRRASIVAISHHQRSTAPDLDIETVIHHGIDVDRFPAGPGDGGYVLFLGRMSPDKGVDRAIHAARAAGRRLVIAAKMWQPDEVAYFHEVVEPLLGEDATFVGQVGGAAKVALLGGATCLVNPIRWPEPFGLVMLESLACGTPVVAFREGAAPEIVDHGVTGFIVDGDDEMVAALRDVDQLSRLSCRAAVRRRFSAERMVAEHLELYERVVDEVSVPVAAAADGRHRGSVRLVPALPTNTPRPPLELV